MTKNNAKLTLNLIPATSWWKSTRSKIKKREWDIIRKKVYEQANYTCEICGVNEQSYLGIKKGWLHCNEVWQYEKNKQILAELEAICRLCHLSQHMGFASIIGRDREAKKHLKKVNNWSEEQAVIYIQEKFQEWEKRNKIEWILDISFLDKYLKQEIKEDKSSKDSQTTKQKIAKKWEKTRIES